METVEGGERVRESSVSITKFNWSRFETSAVTGAGSGGLAKAGQIWTCSFMFVPNSLLMTFTRLIDSTDCILQESYIQQSQIRLLLRLQLDTFTISPVQAKQHANPNAVSVA